MDESTETVPCRPTPLGRTSRRSFTAPSTPLADADMTLLNTIRRSRTQRSSEVVSNAGTDLFSPTQEEPPPITEPPVEERSFRERFPDLSVTEELRILHFPRTGSPEDSTPLVDGSPFISPKLQESSSNKLVSGETEETENTKDILYSKSVLSEPEETDDTITNAQSVIGETSPNHPEGADSQAPNGFEKEGEVADAEQWDSERYSIPMSVDHIGGAVDTFDSERDMTVSANELSVHNSSNGERDGGQDSSAEPETLEKSMPKGEITSSNDTEEVDIEFSNLDKPINHDPYAGVEEVPSLPALPAVPVNLPTVSFRPLNTLDERPVEKKIKRGAAYIRHIEPTEDELALRVEYDMDEQDLCWLNMINDERKKGGLGAIDEDYFERVMDILEKEWFDLNKDIPSSRDDEEDPVCAVCDDGECENSNAIVFCDGCNIAVHQDCYGIPFIPEGQWLCRKCMLSPHKPVDCVLCPHKDGAFKQTSRQSWAHLLCAMWVPECNVGNYSLMEPIVDIEKIPKSRWKLQCYLCHQRAGAPIQCSNKNCYVPFHPTCARKAKLYMKMRAQYGTEHNTFRAFCDKHTPPEYREKVDIEVSIVAFQKDMLEKATALLRERASWLDESEDELVYPTTNGRKRKRKHLSRITDAEESDADLDQPKAPSSHKRKRSRTKHSMSSEIVLTDDDAYTSAIGHTEPLHFSGPIPIIPEYVFNRVLNTLREEHKEQRKKGDFDRKNHGFIIQTCKYWSLKRESRRGAPLLKRLHLEPWTASASALKENEEARAERNETAVMLRTDLERIRMLTESLKKREKEKMKQYHNGIAFTEFVLFPVTRYIRPVFEQIRSWDKDQFFAEPVTAELAPDYHTFITTPMDFATMAHKLENYQYKDIASFEADVELIWKNCMIYNKAETIYYKAAQRFQKRVRLLIDELKQKIAALPIDEETGVLTIVPTEFFGILWSYGWPVGVEERELFPKEPPAPPLTEPPESETPIAEEEDIQPMRVTRAKWAALQQEELEEKARQETPQRKGRAGRRKDAKTPSSLKSSETPSDAKSNTLKEVRRGVQADEKLSTARQKSQAPTSDEAATQNIETPLSSLIRPTRKAAQAASQAVSALSTPSVRKSTSAAPTSAKTAKKGSKESSPPPPQVPPTSRNARAARRQRETEALSEEADTTPAEPETSATHAVAFEDAKSRPAAQDTPRRATRDATSRTSRRSTTAAESASSVAGTTGKSPFVKKTSGGRKSSVARSSVSLSTSVTPSQSRRHSQRHLQAFGVALPKFDQLDLDDNPIMVQAITAFEQNARNSSLGKRVVEKQSDEATAGDAGEGRADGVEKGRENNTSQDGAADSGAGSDHRKSVADDEVESRGSGENMDTADGELEQEKENGLVDPDLADAQDVGEDGEKGKNGKNRGILGWFSRSKTG